MGDKIPKKIYYEDDKHIKIEFVRETKYNWTVPEVNDCQ